MISDQAKEKQHEKDIQVWDEWIQKHYIIVIMTSISRKKADLRLRHKWCKNLYATLSSVQSVPFKCNQSTCSAGPLCPSRNIQNPVSRSSPDFHQVPYPGLGEERADCLYWWHIIDGGMKSPRRTLWISHQHSCLHSVDKRIPWEKKNNRKYSRSSGGGIHPVLHKNITKKINKMSHHSRGLACIVFLWIGDTKAFG